MAGAESGAPAATELPSIRVGSFARLLGLGARLLIGTASAVVTARLLGPSQKGTLSSLLYVVTLLSYGCALGLGQAGTVLAGRGEVDRSRALQISIFSVGATSVGGMVLLAATAWVADWSAITTAVVLAAVFLPVMSLAYVFTAFVNSLERLVLTSGAAVVAALVGLLATALFVGPLQLGVAGGVAGNAVSAAVITCGLGLVLHRSGLRLTPAFELRTVRRLLGFGLPVEAAHLLAALAERVDLLIVYALADERAAGSYAVALTLGRLSVYTANAIAGAAFPRLAILGDNDARRLVPRAARLATVTAVGSSVVLVAVLPAAIPLLFGSAFSDAVWPAVIIAIAGTAYAPQLTLATAAAARRLPRAHLRSFAASVLSMVALDAAFVPAWGGTGAAMATMVSALVGLAVIVVDLRRAGLLTLAELRPGRRDVVELVGVLRALRRG